MVKINPRSSWGAVAPTKTIFSTARTNRTGFMVHHGVGSGGADVAAAKRILKSYQTLHIRNGWGDIGYNFAIDKWGNIYEARGLDKVGAHAGNNNTANVGVVLIGDSRNGDLTPAAKKAYQELYSWVNQQCGKKLAARVHSDVNSTDCPSKPARDWVKSGGLTATVAPISSAEKDRYRAIATFLNPHAPNLKLPTTTTSKDGIPGANYWRLIQALGKAWSFYGGVVDGITGPLTRAAEKYIWDKYVNKPVLEPKPPVVVPPEPEPPVVVPEPEPEPPVVVPEPPVVFPDPEPPVLEPELPEFPEPVEPSPGTPEPPIQHAKDGFFVALIKAIINFFANLKGKW